ncbi:hypothetical protein Pelo_14311 [Pelomyxa schiedti]|nr:hypothetical protein Pelo_14311 [Pelomyxa schiedti]
MFAKKNSNYSDKNTYYVNDAMHSFCTTTSMNSRHTNVLMALVFLSVVACLANHPMACPDREHSLPAFPTAAQQQHSRDTAPAAPPRRLPPPAPNPAGAGSIVPAEDDDAAADDDDDGDGGGNDDDDDDEEEEEGSLAAR